MLGRLLGAIATAPPVTWIVLHVVAPLDRMLLEKTNGRWSLSGPVTGLLVTVGAKTGQVRRTPLPLLWHEGSVILVASKGGAATHPAWYHNLRATPRVHVETRTGRRAFLAEEVTGRERGSLWLWLVEQWGGFAVYERRAAPRTLPLIRLRPVEERDRSA